MMAPNEVAQVRSLEDDREPLLPGASNDHEFRFGRTTPLHHLWLGIRRSSFYLVVFLVFYIMYLALGGLVFSSLEQPLDWQARVDIRNSIEKFLYKYPIISGFCFILFSVLKLLSSFL